MFAYDNLGREKLTLGKFFGDMKSSRMLGTVLELKSHLTILPKNRTKSFLCCYLGMWQRTNIAVIAMEARVILASRRRRMFSQLLLKFC